MPACTRHHATRGCQTDTLPFSGLHGFLGCLGNSVWIALLPSALPCSSCEPSLHKNICCNSVPPYKPHPTSPISLRLKLRLHETFEEILLHETANKLSMWFKQFFFDLKVCRALIRIHNKCHTHNSDAADQAALCIRDFTFNFTTLYWYCLLAL